MSLFCRQAYACTRELLCDSFGGREGAPYFVCVIQHAGNLCNPHYHAHAIVSLGIKTPDGTFCHAGDDLDVSSWEERFRHGLLDMLVGEKLITDEFRQMMLSWKRSGFGTDSSILIPKGDTESLENIAAYVLRPPLSLKRLTYESGAGTVIYQGKYNPLTGSNFQVLDPQHFLLNLLCLVPEPHESVIRYFGAASSSARRGCRCAEATQIDTKDTTAYQEQEPLLSEEPLVPTRQFHPSPSSVWRRLIAKIYKVDPMRCPRCGAQLRVISVINDPARILRHIGRWDPPRGPPAESAPPETTVEYDALPEDIDDIFSE